MIKKDIRINEDNIKINDSLKTEVIRRVIIPHNFVNKKLEVNYFIPRFKKIRKGERVEWFNVLCHSYKEVFFFFYDLVHPDYITI
jgi:hypothetical protein